MFTYKEASCFLGRALELKGKDIELAVTLDVGPRIISLRKPGGGSIMFEDTADAVNKDCSSVYGEGKVWHIYGGHRIWLSPESEATYYPDNEPVSYKITPDGCIFTPPAWEKAEVQPILQIRFMPEGGAEIAMGMTNLSDAARELCIWSLTVLKPGGVLEAGLPTKDTGYLPNRNIVLWPYTDIKDERLEIRNDKLIVKSSTSATKPLKVGYHNPDIVTKYTFGGTVFVKAAPGGEGAYPDFFCNVETYTSNLIHEVETLSPIVRVEAGKTLWHTERWELH